MLTIDMKTLPEELQESIRVTLSVYARTFITLNDGKYTESPHIVLTNTRKATDFSVYTLTAKDVFTDDERQANTLALNQGDLECMNN